jgi:hypothetical protein
MLPLLSVDHMTFLASSWLLPAHKDNISNPLIMLLFLSVDHNTFAEFLSQISGIIAIY